MKKDTYRPIDYCTEHEKAVLYAGRFARTLRHAVEEQFPEGIVMPSFPSEIAYHARRNKRLARLAPQFEETLKQRRAIDKKLLSLCVKADRAAQAHFATICSAVGTTPEDSERFLHERIDHYRKIHGAKARKT